MKVLGINGSARKDGNTAIMIKSVFNELEKEGIETELVQFSGKTILEFIGQRTSSKFIQKAEKENTYQISLFGI